MSLYNMMHGVNPCTFLVLPMLDKHPDDFPRFRDCFLKDDEHPEYEGKIHVYTRTGGGNREGYKEENAKIKAMPGYVTDYDDSFDSTFAMWIFEVPEKWKADHALFVVGKGFEMSQEYRDQIKKVFPKLANEVDEIFKVE